MMGVQSVKIRSVAVCDAETSEFLHRSVAKMIKKIVPMIIEDNDVREAYGSS
jgi:predicted glycosyltransferase